MDAEPEDVPPVCMTLKKLFNLVLQRCVEMDPKCEGELDGLLWKPEHYERLHISIPNTFKATIKATDSYQWMKLQSRAGVSHAMRFPEPDLDKRDA
eukprot:8194575-Karenia_brevis.AAC.1